MTTNLFFVYRDALEENHANLDDLEIKIEKATRLLYWLYCIVIFNKKKKIV